ncbi:MAG: beta-propeller domain-containing protein [Dorea sp.]|nr:beta-propeller domain-containing protein [Dorea sp.]
MHESDKELMDKILNEMEDVQVPESLKPENIETMLKAYDAGKEGKQPVPDKKPKHHRWIYRFGTLAAASLVLIAGLLTMKSGGTYREYGKDIDILENIAEDTLEGPAATKNSSDSADLKAEGELEMATDYAQIYRIFEENKKRYEVVEKEENSGIFDFVDGIFEDSKHYEAAEDAVAEEAPMESESVAGAASDYSNTNTREENVDEGDVVKTDGRYLYILKEKRTAVSIVDTLSTEGGMKNIATIEPKGIKKIQELYLTSDKKQLVIVGENWEEEIFDTDVEEPCAEEDVIFCGAYRPHQKSRTIAITYHLADHAKPKEIGRASQTGYYENSRMADDCLYMFSDYTVPFDLLNKDQPDTYIPCINDRVMEISDVCLPICQNPSRYMVITSVKMSAPSVICDSKAFLSEWGSLYVSEKNIYYYESRYDSKKDSDITIIRSIGYKDGKLTTGHKGSVAGTIDDSFSIDEYKDYLRVITTVYDTKTWEPSNEVNVLDQNLDVVGHIKDLAEGEIVYSARMMGDIGYFVTFRQTDPLFSVDFSNPEHPKIIGKLKIPGFSEYLHPWGENKLLGIGMQADEETGITDGLKLSMFDISDPSDVKEEDIYCLDHYYYSEAFYDYKSVLASYGKNLIGFSCEDGDGMDYLLFSYDEKNGFSMEMNEEVNGNGWFGTRGVYIDHMIYVVRGNVIEAYDLTDYCKKDDLIL